MDPFTQKLLEKTRQRREQLQQKLQSTPTAATRKRKPLQVDTSQNTNSDKTPLSDTENVEEKRRRSSTQPESKPSVDNENMTTKPVSQAENVHSEAEVDSGVGSENVPRQPSVTRGSSSDEPSPQPSTRRGRLQKLACQINNWEDDLSHPNTRPASPEKKTWQRPVAAAADEACMSDSVMSSSSVSNTNGNVRMEAANNKPPKPPRAFQSDTPKIEELTSEPNARRSPRFNKQLSDKSVNNAFAFGSAAVPSPSRSSPARPPQPRQTTAVKYSESRSSQSDDEPTKKAVADRFSMWEKKMTGDALTPLRQGTPLKGLRATPAKQSVFNGAPASQQSQTTEYKPVTAAQSETRQNRPARRRSRSATPNLQTPEREKTGGSAPWQKPSGSAVKKQAPAVPSTVSTGASSSKPSTPRQKTGASEDEWCKNEDRAFQKAPMSARKFAWEAKIAEQQNVASEHNRIMYRTRSATRLDPGTPCQKQQAEDSLKHGQAKVYDPAERAKRERQSELEALQNRFNSKGLLKSEQQSQAAQPTEQPQVKAASLESLDDQHYYTASDSEMNTMDVQTSSNNATAGSSADEQRTVQQRRQVSFKSPTRERKQSASPPHSDSNRGVRQGRSGAGSTGGESTASSASGHSTSSHERKVKRRSSCKLPTLGYDSSSDEEDQAEISLRSKYFPLQKQMEDTETGSPNKIPRLGDESSADSIDMEGMSRQASCSSMGSSVSSDSYCFVSNHPDYNKKPDGTPNSRAVVDFLDEAMSDDEPVIEEIPQRRSPRQHRATPPAVEMRQTRANSRHDKDSPAGLYSIDQYRKKIKSVAQLPNSGRRPVSVYDTDSYTDTDTTSQCSTVSEQDRRKRMKELQELVQQEQNVIVQASNALNQCCQSGSSFAGSTEQVECNRLLLIACQRRQAYLCEIERIKSNPHTYEQRKGKGSLTISDIQLPLKRDFVKKIGGPEDDTVHYFLLMVRNGAQVIVTQMVSTHEALMRGVLHIPNLIKLNDIMNDFRYELEIYGMQVSREAIKPGGKKDKKKGTSSVSRSKSVSGRDGGSHSSSSVRTTNFTHITSLMISMDCVRHTAFKLSRVPYLSPIQGTVHMTLRCTMEANVVFKGFINMFEDVGGFGAWHRRWCVLSNNRVSFWKYPDDERVKEPIGQMSLKDCVTTEVGLVSRDKCARPNTIELVIVRPLSKSDNNADSMNRQIRDRMVYEQHWFGMDTKSDRLEWCTKLNEALANVRQWYSDAARPIPAKRMDI